MILTNWGYTISELESLPDILTKDDFNEYTATKYVEDMRTEKNIKAASAAVRNYCGWHVYPSTACVLSTTMLDGRIARSGGDVLIQLPARYVSDVESVEIDGVARDFFADPSGLLRAFDVPCESRRASVVVSYTAGVPDELMDAVKELIAHRVTHALASSAGVQSETAGGVSITYSANWVNSARSTALADDNKEVLAPYKIQGVF